MQYRIYSISGKKYYTEKDHHGVHSHVSLTPSGRVISYHDSLGFEDITDQVIVEQWIGAFDNQSVPPKKIFDGDKIRVGGPDFDSSFNEELGEYIDVEEYYVEWRGDEQYPAFDLRPVPGSDYQFSCDSNGISHILAMGCRIKVVGTIHDESEASKCE